jgi:hypothetical protein
MKMISWNQKTTILAFSHVSCQTNFREREYYRYFKIQVEADDDREVLPTALFWDGDVRRFYSGLILIVAVFPIFLDYKASLLSALSKENVCCKSPIG